MIEKISDIIIVTDIDGSLLRAKYGVSRENREAIERFVSKGGDFTVSTGRVIEAASALVDSLPITIPSMHINGGYFYDWKTGKIVEPHYIPPASHMIAKIITEYFPEVDCYFAKEHAVNLMTKGEVLARHTADQTFYSFEGGFEDIPDDIYKFIIVAEPEDMPQIREFAATLIAPGIKFLQSSPFFLEMIPEENSKGRALLRLAKMAGKPIENVAAVGDFENDIEMLQTAGIGCAVANAQPTVKAAADMQLVSCEEHAIAQLIEYFERQYA